MSIATVTAAVADFLRVAPLAEIPVAEGRDPARVRELLDQARAGSHEAFGELVTLHERAVFRVTLAALGHRDDAMDAAQDAFVVAWRKLAGFRGDAAFRTWLLTIAWRKALDRRRARTIFWRRTRTVTLAPGFRTGWNLADKQVIIGFAVPVAIAPETTNTAAFAYLSYELPFRR